jgi:hypothetical protein
MPDNSEYFEGKAVGWKHISKALWAVVDRLNSNAGGNPDALRREVVNQVLGFNVEMIQRFPEGGEPPFVKGIQDALSEFGNEDSGDE